MATAAQLGAFFADMRKKGYSDDRISDMAVVMGLAKRVTPIDEEPEERGLGIPTEGMLAGGAVPTALAPELPGPSTTGGAVQAGLKEMLGPLEKGGQQVVSSMGRGAEFVGTALEQSPGPRPPGLRALGRGLQALGESVASPAEERAGAIRNRILDKNFFESLKEDPVKTLVAHGMVQIPQLMAVMIAPGAQGPKAAAFLLEAGNAWSEAKQEGATDQQAAQAAGMTGIANMFLEVKGVNQILGAIKGPKKDVQRFFVNLGKAILGEGSTEGIQEYVSILSGLASYAGDRGLSLNDLRRSFSRENIERIGAAAIIGGLTGGAVGGTVGAGIETAPPSSGQVSTISPAVSLEEGGASLPEGVLPEGEREVVGRPELANPGVDALQRDFNNAVVEERQVRNPVNVLHDKDLSAQVEARLAENGVEQERLRLLADGLSSDPADTGVAKRIIQEIGGKAFATNDQELFQQARDVVMKYHEEGTAFGRAMRFRRDFTMDPQQRARQSLMEATLYPSAKVKTALRKAKTDAERAKAEAAYAFEMQDARQRIADAGIDLNALLTEPVTEQNRAQMQQALDLVEAAKSDNLDKLIEYWRNAILSSPRTHVANFVGNSAFFMGEWFVQKPLELALNRMTGGANEKGVLRAAYGALVNPQVQTRAFSRGLEAFRTERPVYSEEFGDGQKVDIIHLGPRRAIGGKGGRVVRLPFRYLLAADEVAKSVIRDMVIHSEAARVASQENLSLEQRQELINEPTPEMEEAAHREALRLTFQTPLGDIGQSLQDLRSRHRTLAFIAPFIVTPGNIIKVSLKKSPLGIANVAHKYLKAQRHKHQPGNPAPFNYTRNEQVTDWAEQILAWGAAVTLLNLIDGEEDDERPFITGSVPTDKNEREAMFRSGNPPMSIRLGDKYFSYARIEPLAFPLAAAVDLARDYHKVQSGQMKAEDFWSQLFATSTTLIRDKTMMKSLGDLLRLVEQVGRGEGANAAARWATDFVTSFVPNIVKAAKRAGLAELKDEKLSGSLQLPEWKVEGGRILMHKSFPGEGAPIRHDLWGRPIPTSGPFGRPGSDFVYRLLLPPGSDPNVVYRAFSPIRTSNVERSEVDRLILNYNNANPDSGWYPSEPNRSFRKRGETIRMTRAEYQEYVQRSGRMAHEWLLSDLRAGRLDPDNPKERDIKLISSRITEARSRVKALMYR